jgi:hypothetical protein
MTNSELIARLRQEARTLALKGENLYRVRAFRQAAFRLSQLSGEISPEALREAGLGEHMIKRVMTLAGLPSGSPLPLGGEGLGVRGGNLADLPISQ